MDVVVCVKQIPDPADPGELNPDTKTLKRDTKIILDESMFGVSDLHLENELLACYYGIVASSRQNSAWNL